MTRDTSDSKRRFTLSFHFFAQLDARNHIELFLDVADSAQLQTWRHFSDRHRRKVPETKCSHRLRFFEAPDHRRVYLDFAGHVSGNRGKLRILRQGFFVDRRTGCPRSEGRTGRSILVNL